MILPEVRKDQESPLKQYCDSFDVEHLNWSTEDYKLNALQIPVKDMTDLLVKDWKWRKEHGMNVVASEEGGQGTGKSLFCIYAGLLLAQIFGVPFTPKHVFFAPELLEKAISKAKQSETFLRDEHQRSRVGKMSNMINENLADYEDQLRKHQNNLIFSAVDLQSHSHFFCFETKHIIYDSSGKPTYLLSMLKTPRYTDRKQFVWRGMISFPIPNDNFLEGYDKVKDAHLKNLKAKYGNTLDPVLYYAKKITAKREKDLIKDTREGFIAPTKHELIEFIIVEEIGTRRFTNEGYKLLEAKIKEIISLKYAKVNEERAKAIAEEQEEKAKVRKEVLDLKLANDQKKRDAKLKLIR